MNFNHVVANCNGNLCCCYCMVKTNHHVIITRFKFCLTGRFSRSYSRLRRITKSELFSIVRAKSIDVLSADLLFGMDEGLENERRTQLGCHDGHTLFGITAWQCGWNVAAHLPHEAVHQQTHTNIHATKINFRICCSHQSSQLQ